MSRQPLFVRIYAVSLFFVLMLSACRAFRAGAPATLLPSPQVTIVTAAPPTLTPTPTPIPTTEEWIYPYTIDGLREHEYQSGEIKVGEKLNETDVYTSYPIEYPSDGLTITGLMQIPKVGNDPFPIIVMNHGYFNRSIYASGDGTDRAAEFLNRHGYLTLSSDYRSWGDSDIGYSLFYSGLVIDVINLLNAIPSIPQADPERVGMWGHSMGGGVTFKVLAVDSGVKAAVLYSPVSADDADIIDRWGPGCIGDIAAGERLYGCNSSDILPLDLPPGLIQAYKDTAQDVELLREVAALHYLDDVSAPVQIHFGTADGE
ncbi:MAG: alpha/beta fold hydrolase, partial [Anaerolineales bacterium]